MNRTDTNDVATVHRTTFFIQLPIDSTGALSSANGNASQAVRTGPLRILAVDDEPVVLKIVADCLRADGHEINVASTGDSALATFETDQFDLVVIDRAMPGMNGDELAAHIKARAPKTPIIMLTGFGHLMPLTGDIPESVDLVVSKPVSPYQLREAIARVVGAQTAA